MIITFLRRKIELLILVNPEKEVKFLIWKEVEL